LFGQSDEVVEWHFGGCSTGIHRSIRVEAKAKETFGYANTRPSQSKYYEDMKECYDLDITEVKLAEKIVATLQSAYDAI